ncbi:hypothetical protein CK203_109021 [Vitis vinifera]|uniref:Uncharacterized protein n=1 Tax=Vitis vinifera TaxID=29760 RepID=A0A438FEK7_VITVI|nr:hypothetical protein CK203_109021 [Vitis vinifera]
MRKIWPSEENCIKPWEHHFARRFSSWCEIWPFRTMKTHLAKFHKMQSHGNFSHLEVISYELLEGEVFNSKFCINPLEPISMAIERISEGYFFGPHHLIIAALLYFEEKVHQKKLLRADAIPLLFPRLLCQILEHLGYPGAPAGPEHPEQPEEPVDIPSNTQPPAPVVASSEPILEVPPSAPQATPQPPPVIPPILEPFPSAEPRIAIPIIKYRGLCHTFQALATSQADDSSSCSSGANYCHSGPAHYLHEADSASSRSYISS